MNNKQVTIVGVVAILMIILSIVWWMISPTWVSLFPVEITDLEKTSVTNTLTSAAIDYKYDESSKKILIKSEDVLKAHAVLETKGIPQKNGVGLEMFSNSEYGLSEFVQGINYQRAMEEELVRSIRLIKGIKDARVHLAIKKQSIFEEKKEDSKASVILTFKENTVVDSGMVRGVQQIIAAAIPSLSAGSIVILSDDGIILTRDSDETYSAETNTLEQKYTNSISKLLSSYFDHTAYSVTVDVKFDKKKKVTVEENYVPDSRTGKGYLLKSRQSEKKSDVDEAQGTGQNQNLKEEEFAYSKERSEIVYPVGSIEKISAAVVIQGELAKSEKDALQDLIFNSIGMDAARGDTISIIAASRNSKHVTSNDLSQEDPDVAKSAVANNSNQDYTSITKPNLIALVVSLVMLISAITFFMRALNKSRDNQREISSAEREKLIADLQEWMK
ncbi:flagellar M-ring protein [Cellvibrio zantedeschiae]|uniref:Flagellar M-ring protein n=1 Tax=Cellvibrio zantedeschiae TaxID=1237077 RepID=A0ABQ3BAD1_9GAMM|nr:flagellar basal-body MS-ring/collar protein FliF [Cellvibrio zantedeschiae]GGY84933.1 flagellar M-ring protein [Cellvibrio zantedeschiae]